MYQIFPKRPSAVRGTVTLPEFVYIKNGLYANLLKLLSFYRSNPRAVDSSHFLVRILQSINVNMGLEDLYYVDSVDDATDRLAMSLRLTSPSLRGKAFDEGHFYGRESIEILISNSEDFNVSEASINWENLEPIKVLTHPKTDLNLDIPNGKANGSETGICVITINVPMLALQYKKFREREIRTKSVDDAQLTIMQFVAMYPLPNMLYSHLDVALFNRFKAHYENIEPLDSVRRTPIHVIDYSPKVDNYLKKLIQILSRKQMDFATVLASFPLVTEQDLLDLIILPKLPPTRQITWALVIAREPYISFLLDLNINTGSLKNRVELNRIERTLREIRVDKDLQYALPRDFYNEISTKIDKIASYL